MVKDKKKGFTASGVSLSKKTKKVLDDIPAPGEKKMLKSDILIEGRIAGTKIRSKRKKGAHNYMPLTVLEVEVHGSKDAGWLKKMEHLMSEETLQIEFRKKQLEFGDTE